MDKTRGKNRKSNKNADINFEQDNEPAKLTREPRGLAGELAESTTERVNAKLAAQPSREGGEIQPPAKSMADLETILQEIREFRRENFENLKEIRDDIRKTNNRIDDAEKRIVETEERPCSLEEATLELAELQRGVETRMTDLEGRERRENVRIHGVKEGAESNAQSMITFIENLLREKLDLPPSLELKIERAHRALVSQPPKDSPPRSIVMKLQSFRSKEELIKIAWQKKGFIYEGRKVFLDHDYAPEVLRKRKEYTEAKKVLREKKIRFQTPFPAKLRVFYEGETCLYNTAEEATKDMLSRGLQVEVVTPEENWTERIKRLMWSSGCAKTGRGTTETRPGYKQKLQAFRRDRDSR